MLGGGKDAWLAARLADWTTAISRRSALPRTFLLAGEKARDLATALGYFEHNAHRMC